MPFKKLRESIENFIDKYKFYHPIGVLMEPKNQEFLEPFVAPFKDAKLWENVAEPQGGGSWLNSTQ